MLPYPVGRTQNTDGSKNTVPRLVQYSYEHDYSTVHISPIICPTQSAAA